ncbi:MAG: hypothetical protein GY702_06830, partial [Desulfobulbaceae bacterium]|nr:hypothetical protein [Desulfobulbaceae bacterium]
SNVEGDFNEGNGNFIGDIAVFRFYESVLTPTEVTANYESIAGESQVIEVNGSSASVGSEVTLASGALLTMNADGSFSYDPNGQFDYLMGGESTTDDFAYTYDDGAGGTDTATVSITVNGVNDTPTLAASAANDTLTENTDVTSGAVFSTVTIDPIETGDDIASAQLTIAGGIENTDTLTINGTAITGLGSDSSGAITGGHSYSYTQATGVVTITFAGSTNAAAAELVLESITYGIDASDQDPSTTARTVTLNTVTDNGGGADTNADISATATISVGAVNDAPVLTGDLSATMNEGATYTITGTDLGYTDPDDVDAEVTFTTSSATNGRIQVNGIDASSFTGTQLNANQVTFIHDGSETVAASFDVNVEDGNEDVSAPVNSTFNFTVTPLNDNDPVAVDESITVNEGATITTLVGGATSVLDNDTDADLPNDTLSVVVDTDVVYGTLTLNADGTFSYSHDGTENFSDSFTYIVSDADGGV